MQCHICYMPDTPIDPCRECIKSGAYEQKLDGALNLTDTMRLFDELFKVKEKP